MTNLEIELRKTQNDEDCVIPQDIDVMLNYELKNVGPRTYLYVSFEGIELCSSKLIARVSRESAPAVGGALLLGEGGDQRTSKFFFNPYLQPVRGLRCTIFYGAA